MTAPDQHDSIPGATVQAGRGNAGNLTLRLASAAVLAPAAIGSAYLGGWLFAVVCALAAIGILWEWTNLVIGRSDPRILGPGAAALVAALALVSLDRPGAAAAAMAIGALVAGGLTAGIPQGRPSSSLGLWAGAGTIYAGAAFLGPAILRHDTAWGQTAILFLAATVWVTDSSAYFVGRAVGGPLLWPRVSPNKTWSGALGGLAGGVAAGTVLAYASGVEALLPVGAVALVLSICAQIGDLFESAVKRRFGAKDASRLIPGHGGLMDRLDGFLVAALVALLIGVLRQGAHAPAAGLLVW